MKICHIVENLNTGGLETVVISLIQEQLRSGHDCIVLCVFEEGELAYKLTEQNVDIMVCDKRDGFDWKTVSAIRKKIKSFSPDIVHTHNNVAHIYACIATLFLKYYIVNTKHGLGAESTSKQGALFKLTRFKTCRYIFVSSDAMASYTKRGLVQEEKSIVLHNGIDTQQIPRRNMEAKRNYLKKHYISEDSILICMVSRLNRLKDHHTLLHAFAQVIHEERLDCKLVLIGDGDMRESIEHEITRLNIKDEVIMPGNTQDAFALLQGFDVFVLSSHSEGHSIALLEAAAAGLPLIATDVGGNREIVNEDIGVLVGHEDIGGLRQVLSEMVKNNMLRDTKGNNAAIWAEQHASINSMAMAYGALYTDCCGLPQ